MDDINFDDYWRFPEDYQYPKAGDYLKRDYFDTDDNLYKVLEIKEYNPEAGYLYIIEQMTGKLFGKEKAFRIHANHGTGFEEFVILTDEEANRRLKELVFK